MNATPITAAPATAETAAEEPVRIHAHYANVKKLGRWTTAGRFEVRANRGYALLDLRSPEIPEGDLEIHVNLNHSMVKLLLPEDAVVDHWDLQFHGRGTVKDWSAAEETAGGRRVRITGDVRRGEIRVNRGGVATLAAMFSREYVQELRRVHKEGGMPTIDDPTRKA